MVAPPAQVTAPQRPRGRSNGFASADEPMHQGQDRDASVPRGPTLVAPSAASGDELLMRFVLEKRPFDAASGSKLVLWEEVCRLFAAAGGTTVHSGRSASSRVTMLTKALLETPQVLTPETRALVLEYNEGYHKAGGRHCPDSSMLKRLRRNVDRTISVREHEDAATSSEGVPAREAVPGALEARERDEAASSQVVTQPNHGGSDGNHTPNETELESQVNVGPSRTTIPRRRASRLQNHPILKMTSRSRAAVLATYDALLLRLLMEARPWTFPDDKQQTVWSKVADAIAEKAEADGHEIFTTGSSVEYRVQYLCTMSGGLTSRDWTPEVRELVLGYKALRSTDNAARAPQPRQASESGAANEASSPATASAPTQRRVAQDNNVHKRIGSTSEKLSSTTTEIALRVALARQPFRADIGWKIDAWESAAADVNTQLGVDFFKGGKDLEWHIQRVLDQVEADPGSFSRKVRELATQYNNLAMRPATSVQQHSLSSERTEKSRQAVDSDSSTESNHESLSEYEPGSGSASDSELSQSAPLPQPAAEPLPNTEVAQAGATATSFSELLMRQVLEVRPWTFPLGQIHTGWDKVAEALKSINGSSRLRTGSSVRRRVLTLETTEFSTLAPEVRALVKTYQTLKKTAAESKAAGTPGGSKRQTTESPSGRDSRSKRRCVVARDNSDQLDDEGPQASTPASSHASASRSTSPDTNIPHHCIKELAAARAQTAQLIQQFETERRECRLQNQTLVELLRSEREAQRREVQFLLDAIDRERNDRRDEFVAMANLIARSVQPQPAD